MQKPDLGGKKGVSKTLPIAIVVVVLIVGIGGLLYLSTSRSASSTGTNISCSSQASSSAIQISITPGASSSSNAPGYSPDSVTLTIGKNNTVTWTNNDSVHHTVTTSSAPTRASFNSGDMAKGATYTCTFTTPGTYNYYCTYHSWMTGTIVVEAS
jgi:plastocyanin